MIKALSELESENEVKSMLKIEEQIYSNIYREKAEVFSTLYRINSNRIVVLVKAVQGLFKEKSIYAKQETMNFITEAENLIDSLKERTRFLNNKVLSIQEELSDATIQLEDRREMYIKLSDRYEDLVSELEMFKGSEKAFKKLDLDVLLRFEEDFQKSLKAISTIKNEVTILS